MNTPVLFPARASDSAMTLSQGPKADGGVVESQKPRSSSVDRTLLRTELLPMRHLSCLDSGWISDPVFILCGRWGCLQRKKSSLDLIRVCRNARWTAVVFLGVVTGKRLEQSLEQHPFRFLVARHDLELSACLRSRTCCQRCQQLTVFVEYAARVECSPTSENQVWRLGLLIEST